MRQPALPSRHRIPLVLALLLGLASVTFGAPTGPPSFVLIKANLGYLILGIVFVAIGLITLLLTALRTASRDATIFLFGAMSWVWGLRFLLYTRLVPQLLTGDPFALQHLARGLTYVGATAAFGFALAYLGPGWRGSLRRLAQISLAFSCVASLVLVVDTNRDRLLPAFSLLVVLGAITIFANALHPDLRGQARHQGLIAGLGASAVFFVLENLRTLGLVPVPWDVEWIGVLILYVTLGRLIAVRLFTNEHRLAAIRQELSTARRIQKSLLPKRPPQVSGLSIAARYLPMTEVAGDIFDFIEVDDHRLSILVADVSGHGVPAALIASMVKGAFRAQIDHVARPDRVLAGINRILTGQLGVHFVTASCAFVDTEAGSLRYSGAGHPPLLVRPFGTGRCLGLQPNGLILGQFSEATYRHVERSLIRGDCLLFYTDGILEATNPDGQEFGEDALLEFLARQENRSPEHVADDLLTAIGDWTGVVPGESLDDDLTVIVIGVDDDGPRKSRGPFAAKHAVPAT